MQGPDCRPMGGDPQGEAESPPGRIGPGEMRT